MSIEKKLGKITSLRVGMLAKAFYDERTRHDAEAVPVAWVYTDQSGMRRLSFERNAFATDCRPLVHPAAQQADAQPVHIVCDREDAAHTLFVEAETPDGKSISIPWHDREEQIAAAEALGGWMAAMRADPKVCAEMKRDINRWFDAAMPVPAAQQAAPRAVSDADAKTAVKAYWKSLGFDGEWSKASWQREIKAMRAALESPTPTLSPSDGFKAGERDAIDEKLRAILVHRNHRTDGDTTALLDRIEHMSRGDRDFELMVQTEWKHAQGGVPVEALKRATNGNVLYWDLKGALAKLIAEHEAQESGNG